MTFVPNHLQHGLNLKLCIRPVELVLRSRIQRALSCGVRGVPEVRGVRDALLPSRSTKSRLGLLPRFLRRTCAIQHTFNTISFLDTEGTHSSLFVTAVGQNMLRHGPSCGADPTLRDGKAEHRISPPSANPQQNGEATAASRSTYISLPACRAFDSRSYQTSTYQQLAAGQTSNDDWTNRSGASTAERNGRLLGAQIFALLTKQPKRDSNLNCSSHEQKFHKNGLINIP